MPAKLFIFTWCGLVHICLASSLYHMQDWHKRGISFLGPDQRHCCNWMLSGEKTLNTYECKMSLALVSVSPSSLANCNWEENMLCTFNVPSANGTQLNVGCTDTAWHHVSTWTKHCVNLRVHADFALERVFHFG